MQLVQVTYNCSPQLDKQSPGGPPRRGRGGAAATSRYLRENLERTRNGDPDDYDYSSPTKRVYPVTRAKTLHPNAKEEGALRDEVLDLKKQVMAYKIERDMLRGKVHNLEQQASRKNQKIEALVTHIEGGDGQMVANRTLAMGLGSDSTLVANLKNKVALQYPPPPPPPPPQVVLNGQLVSISTPPFGFSILDSLCIAGQGA